MSLGMLANVYTMVRKRCGHTTERKTVTYIEDLLRFKKALHTHTFMLTHSGGGRPWEQERLTFVSLSSKRVSSLFWAARPSWSSLTIRMMWFQLNSRIRSNHTCAWWEYGGTVRRKDRWILWGGRGRKCRLTFWVEQFAITNSFLMNDSLLITQDTRTDFWYLCASNFVAAV